MTAPRRVFFFTDSPAYGGAEQAMLTLLQALDPAHWSPTLLYHSSRGIRPLVEAAARAGVPTVAVPHMPEGSLGARRLIPFASLLRRRRPDVFHAHLTWPLACKFALAGAVLARVPAVVGTHQLVPAFTMTRPTRLQQRVLGRRVGRYIAVSQDTRRRLLEIFDWPPEKIVVVPNAVAAATPDIPRDEALRARLLRDHVAVALVPARLDVQKGHRYLLNAVPRLTGLHVVFAGDGPERDALEARARELGIQQHVTFLGFRDDVPRLMQCSDVVVLPSLVEGFPVSILEAMAARVPVIATAIGGTDEVVVDGVTGLLVPPRDAEALAAAIDRVLSDRRLAEALSDAGSVRVAGEFGVEQMVARVEAVYAGLLARPLHD
jgi:glycosyltransferase involved in cell wall biosynthesis